MKPPTGARIDPPNEGGATKESVNKYRPVRQRTVRSETTKDKAGALPPAVYYTQPPHSKVMFHALTCRVCTIGRAHICYFVNDTVIRS